MGQGVWKVSERPIVTHGKFDATVTIRSGGREFNFSSSYRHLRRTLESELRRLYDRDADSRTGSIVLLKGCETRPPKH